MESFHWGPQFETGLSEVDKQHHRLVDLINQFGNLLAENTISIEDVNHLHSELTEYAVYHFREEEKFMSDMKIDERHLNSHFQVHKEFLDDVSTIYSSISDNMLYQANSLLKYLTHWLAYHILGQDQDLANQIKGIESGMSPREAYDRLERERAKETQPLLEALHGLFEEVSRRNQELKQLNESLEEKVAIRTRKISEVNRHLKELSLTDTLTGLPNRRHAMECLSMLWRDAVQSDSPLACIMIDADHFKEVNDTYGHDAGDLVLIELAKTIQHSLRNDDVVCRLGGDEFFIVCPDTDEKGGMYIAELIRTAVSKLRAATGGAPWHGSISVGVSYRTPDMKTYEELIKLADKGVYAAKEAGKNCVRITA